MKVENFRTVGELKEYLNFLPKETVLQNSSYPIVYGIDIVVVPSTKKSGIKAGTLKIYSGGTLEKRI